MKERSPDHPLRIGITGGIGCGKTTVCDVFGERGINIIDTDIIARKIVQTGEAAYQEVVEIFGSEILSENREIDRKKLRDIVFNQPENLQQLEKITHPRIISKMRQQISQSTSSYCIVCIPLLFEKNLQQEVDRVLVVDIPTDIQKQRVVNRDLISVDQAETIMNHQISRQQRLSLADDVITNHGSVTYLKSQVKILHEQYLELVINR